MRQIPINNKPIINLFFVIYDYSGAKTYANELLGYLSDQDVAVHVIYLESMNHQEYVVFERNGFVEIHIPKVNREPGTIEKYAQRCLDLMTPLFIEKENLVFHLNNSIQVKFGLEAKKRYGGKIVYTLHYLNERFSYLAFNNGLSENHNIAGDALDREIIEVADKIICISKFSQEAICGQYNIPLEKTEVIHNGYGKNEKRPIQNFEHIKEGMGFRIDERLILFAGRLLVEEKGVYILIKAFRKLLEDIPTTRLIFANKGDFDRIMTRCQDIIGNVTFTGKLPTDQLTKLYSIADIGVVPSNFELLGYIPIEMMKHQLPLVISNVPGMNELIQDGVNGLKCEVDNRPDGAEGLLVDTQSLYEKMKTLLADTSLAKQLARNARLHWENHYTAMHMGEATIELYQQMLYPDIKMVELALAENKEASH